MSSHVTICGTVLEFWSVLATSLAKVSCDTQILWKCLMISSGQVGILWIELTDTCLTLTDYYLLLINGRTISNYLYLNRCSMCCIHWIISLIEGAVNCLRNIQMYSTYICITCWSYQKKGMVRKYSSFNKKVH